MFTQVFFVLAFIQSGAATSGPTAQTQNTQNTASVKMVSVVGARVVPGGRHRGGCVVAKQDEYVLGIVLRVIHADRATDVHRPPILLCDDGSKIDVRCNEPFEFRRRRKASRRSDVCITHTLGYWIGVPNGRSVVGVEFEGTFEVYPIVKTKIRPQ